jgi:hypothetical protein
LGEKIFFGERRKTQIAVDLGKTAFFWGGRKWPFLTILAFLGFLGFLAFFDVFRVFIVFTVFSFL